MEISNHPVGEGRSWWNPCYTSWPNGTRARENFVVCCHARYGRTFNVKKGEECGFFFKVLHTRNVYRCQVVILPHLGPFKDFVPLSSENILKITYVSACNLSFLHFQKHFSFLDKELLILMYTLTGFDIAMRDKWTTLFLHFCKRLCVRFPSPIFLCFHNSENSPWEEK
jgi:hypothetical protein